MKNNNGFTLLELILCISIMTLILSIPAFKMNIFQGLKEKQEIREFVKDINYARNRAITEGVSHSVLIDTKTNSYTLYKLGDGIKKQIKHKELQESLQIKWSNTGEVVFNLSGAVYGAGTIRLKNSKGKVIEIAITPVTSRVNVSYK
ncbi:MAG: prepilin-type N-terminal cleavage/methylation domain-containing protein [Tissierellia bacterium]|nr:prepilin-type N-terminal cleavage/methylation domain-containing protein [Tissierellia bacterium]